MQPETTQAHCSTSLIGNNWALLNFEDAMFQMERTLQLYKDGHIHYMVFDFETAPSFNPWQGDVIMYSWAHTVDNFGYAVAMSVNNEVAHDRNSLPYPIPEVRFSITLEERQQLIAKMRELLLLIPIVGHNLKYDIKWGAWHRWLDITKIKIFADTLCMGFQLFNKRGKGTLTLKTLANMYCGIEDHWEYDVFDYLDRYSRVKDRHFGNLPTGLIGPYAAKDSIYNRYLFEKLDVMMPDWMRNINSIVTYAIKPFAEAETKGIAIDENMRDFLSNCYKTEQDKAMATVYSLPIIKKYIEDKMVVARAENAAKKRAKKTEEELLENAFNISSNKHLGELIYGHEYYAIPVMKEFKTEKGAPQVNKDFIEFYLNRLSKFNFEEQAQKHYSYIGTIVIPEQRQRELDQFQRDFGKPWEFKQFLQSLAVYKRLEKLKTTYLDSLPEESFEGLYKPNFELTFVKTGRLSSGFHTVPGGCDIKRLYTSRWAPEGGLFVAVDQSQLELRVVAALSGETKLIEAFQKGLDAHKTTAANIYKIPLEHVTDKQRKVGKVVNFALLYGKSARNLAEELGVSVEEAESILRGFFEGYDKLTAWIKYQQNYVRTNKCIVTPWGRKIPIVEAESNDKWELLKADRVAVNYPVQSTASDIVLSSVNGIWNRLKFIDKMNSLLIGSVHDSIEIDVYPGELFKVCQILQEESVDNIIKSQSWLNCPLELSFEIGNSWGGALECKILELTDNKLVFESEDIRKDFLRFQSVASKCYDVKIEVLKESPVNESKQFGEDVFVRDSLNWEAKVTISK